MSRSCRESHQPDGGHQQYGASHVCAGARQCFRSLEMRKSLFLPVFVIQVGQSLVILVCGTWLGTGFAMFYCCPLDMSCVYFRLLTRCFGRTKKRLQLEEMPGGQSLKSVAACKKSARMSAFVRNSL